MLMKMKEMLDFFKKEEQDITITDLWSNSFEEEKTRLGMADYFKKFSLFLVVSVVMGMVLSVIPIVGMSVSAQSAEPLFNIWKDVPEKLPEVSIAQRNKLYDKNGVLFAEIWNEDRVSLKSLKEISNDAIVGLVDTEDKRFYEHKGIDLIGTARALLNGSGGGSGLTQQLIKNLQFYNLLAKNKKAEAVERSVGRKIKELKLAMKYEETHTKDEILLNYFNTVAFGGPSIYGIETASKYFFNKSAKDLSLAEASLLVGTAQNASLYNLDVPENKVFWKKRQKEVLMRMLAEKHITRAEYDKAKAEEIKFVKKDRKGSGTCYESKYPFYCKYVMDYILSSNRLADTLEERKVIIDRGGLSIKTFLDPETMNMMNEKLKKAYGTKNRIVSPVVVVEPGTGGVQAFAINRDFGSKVDKGQTEILVPNIPSGGGSTYKMFMLAAALNSGMTEKELNFSSNCPLYPGPNYDSPPGGYKNSVSCSLQGGPMNYKTATAYSSNTWFVTLEMKVGVQKLKEFSQSVGLAAPDSITSRSLSYTLGSVENSPIDVAAAFATFANKGVYCPATPLKSINYLDGSEIPIPDGYDPAKDSCRGVMSPKDAGIVLKAMRANVSGEIKGAFGNRAKISGYDTAGKSGTNELLSSSWAHLSSHYSLFANAYDMDKTTRGIDGLYFRGSARPWYDNTAETMGAEILKELLKNKKNIKMDYDNPSTETIKLPVNESDFFIIPSVVGMKPEQAMKTLLNAGVKTHVSKTQKPLPKGFTAGVIVEQSIPAGTKLSKGTKKEIIIFIGG